MNPSDRKIHILLEDDLEVAHQGHIPHPGYVTVHSQLYMHVFFMSVWCI